MKPAQRVIRLGKAQSEKTDPEYLDKQMAQLVKDVRNCPEDWLGILVAGLPMWQVKRLKEMGILE